MGAVEREQCLFGSIPVRRIPQGGFGLTVGLAQTISLYPALQDERPGCNRHQNENHECCDQHNIPLLEDSQ
jgi:hypothetical protein